MIEIMLWKFLWTYQKNHAIENHTMENHVRQGLTVIPQYSTILESILLVILELGLVILKRDIERPCIKIHKFKIIYFKEKTRKEDTTLFFSF